MIRAISKTTAEELALRDLKLSAGTSLISEEGIACLLRRGAGELCPCSPHTLVQVVYDALMPLFTESLRGKEHIEDVFGSLCASGDLIETEDWRSGTKNRVIYRAPPSFVLRNSGIAIVIGVAPDDAEILPPQLAERVEFVGHLRFLRDSTNGDIKAPLLEHGLIEIPKAYWYKLPRESKAEEVVARYGQLLEQGGAAGSLSELQIIDPATENRFYRGRWRAAKLQNGCFVGRRARPYGADLWCYVQLVAGAPRRLLNLPTTQEYRACDEAWYLQAAIDAGQNNPQTFRVRQTETGAKFIDLFSPIPAFAQRRLETVGIPHSGRGHGALISYEMAPQEFAEESQFLRNFLWMVES